MPSVYSQSEEETRHVLLRNFPEDILKELDEIRAYHQTPRKTMIIRLLREALVVRSQTSMNTIERQ